jgi:hypothetical protein
MPCGEFLASTNRRRFYKHTPEKEIYCDLYGLHDLVSKCEEHERCGRESEHPDSLVDDLRLCRLDD